MSKFVITFLKDNKFYDEVYLNANNHKELDNLIKNHLDKYHNGVKLVYQIERI